MLQSTVAGDSAQTSQKPLYMQPTRLEGGTCCSTVHGAYFSLCTGAIQHINPAKLCISNYITYITVIKAHLGIASGVVVPLHGSRGPGGFSSWGPLAFFTEPPW
jgi:hypothetical protein